MEAKLNSLTYHQNNNDYNNFSQFLHNVSFDVDQTSSNYDIQFPVITMNIYLTRQVLNAHGVIDLGWMSVKLCHQ